MASRDLKDEDKNFKKVVESFKKNDSYFQKHTASKPEVLVDYPFGPDAQVWKIHGKMFALFWGNKDGTLCVNLKCEPMEAQALRDVFEAVSAGYHMNKKHWNTVILDDSIPRGEVERMIDRSYGLVVKGLTKTLRHGLEIRHGEAEIYK